MTSVGVAVSLLLSLTLAFSGAAAGWVSARASEAQRVADAAALAGANAVSSFSTIAQTLDACVLSMGLAGMVGYAGGLVTACVPGMGAVAEGMCEAGSTLLEARRDFAREAAGGLRSLEATLPLLVVSNSAACVAANSPEGPTPYAGCAIPFPAESMSDFSALEDDASVEGLEGMPDRLSEAAEAGAEARARVDEALRRGWLADCGGSPRSMRERAESLAGLGADENPDYPDPLGWGFSAPLLRARAYYARRLQVERPQGPGAEEMTDSACRRAYYAHALRRVREGSVRPRPGGGVEVDLPELPRNEEQTRATELFSREDWPCTSEAGGRTLHASPDCPGATGAPAGTASLADLDAGSVARCPTCRMGVEELGRVASASSSIDNGFEYHWRRVVEAARDYQAARDDLARAEGELAEVAGEGAGAFERAIAELGVARPRLCPPGAWGCVSVVCRPEGGVVPTELTRSFLSSAQLPAGAAVSAAALAPDDAADGGDVLSAFFDGLAGSGSLVGGALDSVMGLWGSLLVGYGDAYGNVADVAGGFLDRLDGVLGGTSGAWLRDRIGDVLHATGFEPVDMRPRKPVLVGTQPVLAQAGYDRDEKVRSFLRALPESGSAAEFARAVGVWLVDEAGGPVFTIARLEIPGTSVSIPITVALSELLGAR